MRILLLILFSVSTFAATGSWNGIAFSAWNGVAQTGWNGTSISCAGAGGGSTDFVSSISGGEDATLETGYRGYKIVVGASNINVTQLGCYFTSGTYADVTVKLKDSSCVELASSVVPISGSTANAFNWAPELGSPVTLTAGGTYYITQNVGGFNGFKRNATYTTTAAASITDSADENCTNEAVITVAVNFRYE